MPNAADPRRPTEAVQTPSDSPQEVPTASKKRSETAITNNKHTTPQVPMKDYYSVQDVAALLGTREDSGFGCRSNHGPRPIRTRSERASPLRPSSGDDTRASCEARPPSQAEAFLLARWLASRHRAVSQRTPLLQGCCRWQQARRESSRHRR